VKVLFWLSTGLWVVALVSYAVILSGSERQLRKETGTPFFIAFEALGQRTGSSRVRRILYRTLVLSAIGAILSGGLFLFNWK
jgi:hypothetical protein